MSDTTELELKDAPEYDELARLLIKNYLKDANIYKEMGACMTGKIQELKEQTKTSILTKTRGNLIFHGGCLSCSEQSLNTCIGCQFLDFGRNFGPGGMLPDLSNKN
jgi:hypothetical protein